MIQPSTMTVLKVVVEVENIKKGDIIYTEDYLGCELSEDVNVIFNRAIIGLRRK